jgi:membrane-associated phospholipid phosphatase
VLSVLPNGVARAETKWRADGFDNNESRALGGNAGCGKSDLDGFFQAWPRLMVARVAALLATSIGVLILLPGAPTHARPARNHGRSVIVDLSVLDQWGPQAEQRPLRPSETETPAAAAVATPSRFPAPSPSPVRTASDVEQRAPAAGASTQQARSQSDAAREDESSHPMLRRRYYENFVRTPVEFLSSPLNWETRDWGVAALVAGGFVGIMFADRHIRDFWQHDVRNGATDNIATVGAEIGPSGVLLPVTAAAMLAGVTLGDRQMQIGTMEAFQSLVLALGLTEGIKLLARRQRPNESPDDSFRFDGPGAGGNHKSFPSGHVSGTFAVATSFALTYPGDDFVAPVAYSLAGLVAWSRINDDKHWTTDVLLGAGLGYALGHIVHRLSPFGETSDRVTAAPYLEGDTEGIRVTLKF